MAREAAGGFDLTRPDTYTHWVTDTVRFSDQDGVGHVNNVAIAAYVETGRLYFSHYVALPELGPREGVILAHVAIDYLAESRWPGHVDVGCRISRVGGKSFTVATGVFKDGRVIATAQSVIAYRRGGGTAAIEGGLRARLQALLDQAGHDGRIVAG